MSTSMTNWMVAKKLLLSQGASKVSDHFSNVITPKNVPEFVIPHQALAASSRESFSDRSSCGNNIDLLGGGLGGSPGPSSTHSCPVTPSDGRSRSSSLIKMDQRPFGSAECFAALVNLARRRSRSNSREGSAGSLLGVGCCRTDSLLTPEEAEGMKRQRAASDAQLKLHGTRLTAEDTSQSGMQRPKSASFSSIVGGRNAFLKAAFERKKQPKSTECTPPKSPRRHSQPPQAMKKEKKNRTAPDLQKHAIEGAFGDESSASGLVNRRQSSLTSADEKLYLKGCPQLKIEKSTSVDVNGFGSGDGSFDSDECLSPVALYKCHSQGSGLSDISDTIDTSSSPLDKGQIRFSLQYLPGSEKLRVRLLKGRNLGGSGKQDADVTACVKLSLMPGKLQKKTSRYMKGTKAPTFSEEFDFVQLPIESVSQVQLRLKIVNKESQKTKHEVLGEVKTNLDPLELTTECFYWKNLKPATFLLEQGRIQLSLRLDPKAERLTVTLCKAKDLPKSRSGKNPDAQVRIWTIQHRKEQMKRSRVRNSTTCPSWKEAFSFLVSPNPDDLKHNTTVTVVLHDVSRESGDNIVGKVTFGKGTLQDSAICHWNKALQHCGREFTEWHQLQNENTQSEKFY